APFEVKSAASTQQPAAKNKQSSEAKLIIQIPAIEKISVAEEVQAYNEPETCLPDRQARDPKPGTTKLSALDKIRKQYQGNGNNGNGHSNHPLNDQGLQQAWNEYVQKLKEAKSSAAHSFEVAVLRIKDENTFEAVTADTIEKQFIEQERGKLFYFLQEKLQNRLLQFSVIIEENKEAKPQKEISLTAKEQFMKMAEQYPLVKELKDRLKLELDY
ncbi:MAG: hypothetical protein AAB221_16115, partial [Bacteroidota bacterium]